MSTFIIEEDDYKRLMLPYIVFQTKHVKENVIENSFYTMFFNQEPYFTYEGEFISVLLKNG